ncbi:hypothetical protein QTP88_018336 [Uroleucon formosanum]
MPNVGGSKPSRRKLRATNHRQLILAPQRRMAIRVASAYRTTPTDPILVVAGFTSIHLAARGRTEARRLTSNAYGMDKRVAKRLTEGRINHWWQTEWEERTKTGEWTRRLIPNVSK